MVEIIIVIICNGVELLKQGGNCVVGGMVVAVVVLVVMVTDLRMKFCYNDNNLGESTVLDIMECI